MLRQLVTAATAVTCKHIRLPYVADGDRYLELVEEGYSGNVSAQKKSRLPEPSLKLFSLAPYLDGGGKYEYKYPATVRDFRRP